MEITIPINIKGHKDYKIQECDTAIAMVITVIFEASI